MKQALILHAWFNHPQDQWYPWLTKELLKKGYKVYIPKLPTLDTNAPDMRRALPFITKHIPLDKDFIVIGHSLGCLLALRLAEKHEFQKMFLVVGWDFDDLTAEHASFWPNKINHAAIKNNVKKSYVIASDNDPYTTEFTQKEMSKRLDAKFVLAKGAGHFTKQFGITKIPEIIEHI